MQSFKLKFLGVTILQGVEFPIFLLISEWALQQCSATVLPVMSSLAIGSRRHSSEYIHGNVRLSVRESMRQSAFQTLFLHHSTTIMKLVEITHYSLLPKSPGPQETDDIFNVDVRQRATAGDLVNSTAPVQLKTGI